MTSEPTSERLARDLENAGLPAVMVERAREGYYDDYKSPLPMPEMQLYQDLKAHGRDDLAEKVTEGYWDATKEESEAWAASPEGQEVFAALGPRMAKDVFGVDVPADIDEDMLIAGADMVVRAGGKNFEVGWHPDDDDKPLRQQRWYAQATFHDRPDKLGAAAGRTARVDDKPGPDFAADALARGLLEGGACQHCGKTIRLNAPRSQRNAVCRYQRDGRTWKRGCE